MLLQHRHLTTTDKFILDTAHGEEYNGLSNLPCWTIITEKEFKHLKSLLTKVLHTMAVSTIKFDKHSLPVCTKYRIVDLGNLRKTEWSKSNVYAPVMSLLELRLLTALAVCHKCVLKTAM